MDKNGNCNVFVKDMVTHATTRVSTNSAGGEVHGFSVSARYKHC